MKLIERKHYLDTLISLVGTPDINMLANSIKTKWISLQANRANCSTSK